MSVPAKFYLFKRANGFWYVLYDTDRGKRWKSTRTTRKVEVVSFLRSFQVSEQKKSRTAANTLLSAFIDDYLSYCSPLTDRKRMRVLAPRSGSCCISSVTSR